MFLFVLLPRLDIFLIQKKSGEQSPSSSALGRPGRRCGDLEKGYLIPLLLLLLPPFPPLALFFFFLPLHWARKKAPSAAAAVCLDVSLVALGISYSCSWRWPIQELRELERMKQLVEILYQKKK
jgi:hypothetical protein